jgi:predicted cupin superfamily sugar epimerase
MADDARPKVLKALIERLNLQPHPEGGWFREVHRSPVILPAEGLPEGYDRSLRGGDRCAVTSILFLLPAGGRARWHRIQSEEIWLHQQGDDVRLMISETVPGEGGGVNDQHVILGQGAGAELQAVVPRRWWQSAQVLPGECGYALVACIVAPGFEFADFEFAGD